MHLNSCLQIWFTLFVGRLPCWFVRKVLTYVLKQLIRFLAIHVHGYQVSNLLNMQRKDLATLLLLIHIVFIFGTHQIIVHVTHTKKHNFRLAETSGNFFKKN
jgi:hypothetical protein